MNEFKRVALFYAPEKNSPLSNFGASWLGWNVDEAQEAAHLKIDGLPRAIEEITQTPRKYGFHGTIKAPFRLREDKELSELCEAGRTFGQNTKSFIAGPMKIHFRHRFATIVPAGDALELNQFAEKVVREFEPFRAPLNEAEIARRRKSNLTPHQDALMLKWGYPYIFDQFGFHLTLAGPLEPEEGETVRDVLSAELADILSDPLPVSELCLYGERTDGRFEIIERFPLAA